MVLSGTWNGIVKLWELATGVCVHIMKGHTALIRSVCFSPDGRMALSGSDDDLVKLWDMNTGACMRTLAGHTSYVNSVCFSPDGKLGLSGSSDETVKLWDIATGRCIRTFTGHSAQVIAVCFSSNGRFIFSGSRDETIKKWQTPAKTSLESVLSPIHSTEAMIKESEQFLSIIGEINRLINQKDIINALAGLKKIRKYKSFFSNEIVFEISKKIASYSICRQLDQYVLRKVSNTFGVPVDFCWNEVSVMALLSYKVEKLKLWNITTNDNICTLESNAFKETRSLNSACFSPDGRKALSYHDTSMGKSDYPMKLWDLTTKACIGNYVGGTPTRRDCNP
jgi:WD40 repeat protein